MKSITRLTLETSTAKDLKDVCDRAGIAIPRGKAKDEQWLREAIARTLKIEEDNIEQLDEDLERF